MPITLSKGIFSGLDTQSIITQLLAVERRPIAKLQVKISQAEAQVSALGTLKSAISDIRSSLSGLKEDTLPTMSASSGDTSIFTASANTSASEGQHNVKVKQLATSQTLVSQSFASTNAEVADLSVVASQKFKIAVGSNTSEITIDSDNNSLSGLSQAINDAGVGVNATVVDAGFEVTASNNTIIFNDGSQRTATLTEGSYTSNELAEEIKRAMEAANGGADTYTVSYNTSGNKFEIANDSGNANSIDIEFENAGTTAYSLLGFNATDHAAIAVGSSATADNAVGAHRLILSTTGTGTENRIVIQTDEDNDGTYEEAADTDTTGLSRFAYNPDYDVNGDVASGTANLSQTQAAVDAKFDLDGLTVVRSSNTVSDVLTGVTLNLLKADTSASHTLSVKKDNDAVEKQVDDFISAYNAAVGLARSLSANDEKGRSILAGDSISRGLVRDLRNTTIQQYGEYKPATLGLSHTKDGELTLDGTILKNFLEKDYDNVINSFDTMAEDIESLVDNFLNSAIPARTDGLESKMDRYQDQISSINRRVIFKEEQLIKTYARLEQTMGQLQASSDFIAQQLANLPSSSEKSK